MWNILEIGVCMFLTWFISYFLLFLKINMYIVLTLHVHNLDLIVLWYSYMNVFHVFALRDYRKLNDRRVLNDKRVPYHIRFLVLIATVRSRNLLVHGLSVVLGHKSLV